MSSMFDKVVLHGILDSMDHADYLISLEHLQRCSEGDTVYYSSTALANLSGIQMRIDGYYVRINCSLHKMYYRAKYGRLDNTQMFTISEARTIVRDLLSAWSLDIRKVRVTYYEVGLNLPVDRDPLEYISIVHSVGGSREKELFNDANFDKNRQKTTERGRAIKKVFKIYDKGYEARSKGHDVEGNILRIETIYRRQDIPLQDFLSTENVSKMLGIFYRDWLEVSFERKVSALPGVKVSQVDKAEKIIKYGTEKYLQMSRDDYAAGTLSAKQFRTIREFIQKWPQMREKFKFIPTAYELEYLSKYENMFKAAQN